VFQSIHAQSYATEVYDQTKLINFRVSDYMKVLNRAKLEEQANEADRRTSSGRYMARRG
jgi:hypothetical protein